MPVKVLTDHKGLKYFMSTKKLTPRQARWAEFLSEFNFKVTYQTGKKNDKADALTRKLNKRPANEEDKQQEYKMQVLLPLERVELQLIKVDEPRNEPPNEPQPAKRTAKAEEAKELGRSHAAEPHAEKHAAPKEETNKDLKDKPTLPDRVKEVN